MKKLFEILKSTFSDKHVAARKCGFQGKIFDNMCFNYIKKSTLPHISALLEHCLPRTSFDKDLEHATQFERKREFELDEKKANELARI